MLRFKRILLNHNRFRFEWNLKRWVTQVKLNTHLIWSWKAVSWVERRSHTRRRGVFTHFSLHFTLNVTNVACVCVWVCIKQRSLILHSVSDCDYFYLFRFGTAFGFTQTQCYMFSFVICICCLFSCWVGLWMNGLETARETLAECMSYFCMLIWANMCTSVCVWVSVWQRCDIDEKRYDAY